MTTERYKKGMEQMYKHIGPDADKYLAKLKEISPFFEQVNVEFPFGDLYSRPILDAKSREIAAISALTVMGYAKTGLAVHVEAALNCGMSKEEILEIIIQMIAYGGFPAATEALKTAGEVFDKLGQ